MADTSKVAGIPAKNMTNEFDGFIFSERLRGIEPLSSPWQGEVLPLNHSRAWRVNHFILTKSIIE